MAQLDRLNRSGFPIGLSIDFRRAMHRFESARVACPPNVTAVRKAQTLLIDGRPAEALREVTAVEHSQKAALVQIAREQLGNQQTVPKLPVPTIDTDPPRANVVIPFAIEYGGMRIQLGIARALAEAGFEVQILQMRNNPRGETFDPSPFHRIVDIKNQQQLIQELSARHAALTLVGCWVDYAPAIEANTAPVIGYSGGEPPLNDDNHLDDRMLAFRDTVHRLPIHLVTCSRFVQRLYHQRFGRTASYVPAALDDRAFNTRMSPCDDRPFRVLVMAWDGIADKGLGDAIPALERIRRSIRDFQIVWITPRPPIEFTDLECELHVDPPKDELYRIVGTCHAMVYTPIVDGLGLPPLEAMAAGIPVVVSVGTGPDEYARDGVNAICVPPKGPEAIEVAVRRLLDDYELRHSLGVHGRATASRYHRRATSPALMDVIAQVLRYGPVYESVGPVPGRSTA